jgi:hypothetical protein
MEKVGKCDTYEEGTEAMGYMLVNWKASECDTCLRAQMGYMLVKEEGSKWDTKNGVGQRKSF